MKTKHAIMSGALLVFLMFIAGIAVLNISGPQAVEQSESATSIAITETPFQIATPENVSGAVGVPTQIPACAFEMQIQPAPANPSLDVYVFFEPEVVLTGKTAIRLYQWLPDNQRWLVGRSKDGVMGEYIETFDLNTGEIKLYAERRSNAGKPIWLPAEQAVAFVDSMPPDYTKMLYLARGEDLQVEELAANLANPILSLSSDGQQIIYSANARGIQTLQFNKPTVSTSLITDLPGQDESGWAYSDAWRKDRTMAAVYMYQPSVFYLVDRMTGETCEMNLEQVGNSAHTGVSASDMGWSADGRYLALRRVYGNPESFLSIRIVDTQEKKFHEFTFEGRSAYGLDWSPTDNMLLIAIDVDSDPSSGSFDNLYLLDVATYEILPILPGYQFWAAGYSGILWSPNGKSLGVAYSELLSPNEMREWRLCTIAVEVQQ